MFHEIMLFSFLYFMKNYLENLVIILLFRLCLLLIRRLSHLLYLFQFRPVLIFMSFLDIGYFLVFIMIELYLSLFLFVICNHDSLILYMFSPICLIQILDIYINIIHCLIINIYFQMCLLLLLLLLLFLLCFLSLLILLLII